MRRNHTGLVLPLFVITGSMSIGILTAVFSATAGATTAGLPLVDQTNPVLRDINKIRFSLIYLGDTTVISTTIANNHDREELPFVAIVEARTENGVTEYLQWQSGQLEPQGKMEMGFSWTPQDAGQYELRVFSISNFTRPEVLTLARTTTVSVQAVEEEDENDGFVWMAKNTTQCAEPWDVEYGQDPVKLSEGQTLVHLFFEKRGIAILDMESVRYLPEDAFVCLACNCTSGETLYVKVSSSSKEEMEAHGFIEKEEPPPFE